jgi:rare lipoprotein A
MARAVSFRVFLLGAGVALSGCADLPGGAAPAAREAGRVTQMAERDVEAPEVFAKEEPGLWDGRPSLGGVWVAHPDATDPERVAIRNVETGATVMGALFRRERDFPGPRFQMSSEAANALGVLAGRPTPVRVTAVRLEQVAAAPAAADEEAEATPAAAAEPGGIRGALRRFRPQAAPTPLPSDVAEQAPE